MPSAGDLPHRVIKPVSLKPPALGDGFFTNSTTWEHSVYYCCSVTQSCTNLCNPMNCSTPGFPVLYHLQEMLKLMSFESLMPHNYFILCHPLPLLPSIFASIRVFLMSRFFASDGQTFEISGLASALLMNIQD